jgi:hypothetical protein
MTTYINPNQIIRIKVENFKENYNIGYLKRKSFLGVTILEEGFYIFPDCSVFRDKIGELPSYSVLKDGLVYYKPNVQITFQDKSTQRFFETYEEAQKYAKDIADKYELIPL